MKCDGCPHGNWENERQLYYCFLNHWYVYNPGLCGYEGGDND